MSSAARVPSEGAIRAAAATPGMWVYEIDPWFDADGPVPPHGILGAWKSDEQGRIVGEFQVNGNYRPSPASLGFRRPLSELEDAIQREVAGYADPDALVTAVAAATVWVVQLPGHDGDLSVADSSAGKVVEAYTSPDLVGNGVLGDVASAPIGLSQLLSMLPNEVRVVLNPGTTPNIVIPHRAG